MKRLLLIKLFQGPGPVAHSVILAAQEAEIQRIIVQRQPQENSSGDPIWKKPITKKGLVLV
jgi:hypothetical protein